jgi:uncharacterized membrane protein YhdT
MHKKIKVRRGLSLHDCVQSSSTLNYHQENFMPIELRKWFQLFIVLLSILFTGFCWLAIRAYIPAADLGAQIGASVLMMAAMPGFFSLLRLSLPLLLLKLWPGLEK